MEANLGSPSMHVTNEKTPPSGVSWPINSLPRIIVNTTRKKCVSCVHCLCVVCAVCVCCVWFVYVVCGVCCVLRCVNLLCIVVLCAVCPITHGFRAESVWYLPSERSMQPSSLTKCQSIKATRALFLCVCFAFVESPSATSYTFHLLLFFCVREPFKSHVVVLLHLSVVW